MRGMIRGHLFIDRGLSHRIEVALDRLLHSRGTSLHVLQVPMNEFTFTPGPNAPPRQNPSQDVRNVEQRERDRDRDRRQPYRSDRGGDSQRSRRDDYRYRDRR